MIGLFILTIAVVEFMSKAATAALALIAVNAALQLNIDPHAFAMGVAVAASFSYRLPGTRLVYGPGGYRFFDYTKVVCP